MGRCKFFLGVIAYREGGDTWRMSGNPTSMVIDPEKVAEKDSGWPRTVDITDE
jgi:hypothetical protein